MKSVSTRMAGIKVAVPESRELDTLAELLERRGATALRVPLVGIHDAPDPAPVLDWIRGFNRQPPGLFIILTGEGIRRLLALASRHGLQEAFVAALGKTVKLCRGPKPERALREVGLKAEIQAAAPTTEGIIRTLETMAISEERVCVQLYGDDPNTRLMDYLRSRLATVDPVAPYVYADDAEEERVVALIRDMAAGGVDAIAFTSQPQVRRLLQVAFGHGLQALLQEGLARCRVAAVGPVVRGVLEEAGIRVDIMPAQAFFMKPLVTEIMRHFDGGAGA